MSCTHDCGCSPETRDARTDEWVQIAPESARPATLTPEQPGMLVEVRIKDFRVPSFVPIRPMTFMGHEAEWWITEDKPAQEPDTDTDDAVFLSGPMTNRPAFHAAAAALRAQGHVVINPAEVDLGPDATWADYMRFHLAEIARRVTQVFVLPGWESSRGAQLEVHVARALGLTVEDAPAPVDPDAEALDQMAQAMANLDGSDDADEWVPWAEVALDALRKTHDVTARAEQ